MVELAETCRLAVMADLTNLYLLQSQGGVSLYSPQGEEREILTGEEGGSVERCVRTRRHVMATCKVSSVLNCWYNVKGYLVTTCNVKLLIFRTRRKVCVPRCAQIPEMLRPSWSSSDMKDRSLSSLISR